MEMRLSFINTFCLMMTFCVLGFSQSIVSPQNSFAISGQGALLGGCEGRSPWNSAAAISDSSKISASFSYVNLIGVTQTAGDFRLLGGGLRFTGKRLSLCTAVGLFDALSVWRETFIHTSLGLHKNHLALSADLDACEFGIVGAPSMRDNSARAGFAGFIHGKFLSAGLSANIPVYQNDIAEPSRLSRAHAALNLQAAQSPIGAPGICIEIRDIEYPQFSITVGEYFRVCKFLAPLWR